MKEYTVQVSGEMEKAILAHIEDIQTWLQGAINSKGEKCMERLLVEISDKRPEKISQSEKKSLLSGIEILPYSSERQEKPLKDRFVKK